MQRDKINFYVDNFRGFSKTVIALKDVNFLIGENSTGKTSILALINLFCSPDFWFSQKFDIPNYEFGGFRDILSINSKNKKFTIGFCQRIKHKKTKIEANHCFLFSYEERKGLPGLSSFIHMDREKLLLVRILKNTYEFHKINVHPDWSQLEASNLFSFLLQTYEQELKNLKRPKLNSHKSHFSIFSIFDNPLTIFPFVPLNAVWFAPIRTQPKRTYDGYGGPFSPEGIHTPYLLRMIQSDRRKKKSCEVCKNIEKFGIDSGLFCRVSIKRFGKRNADAPFELLVELASERSLRINSVGYGVSQVLPLVVEILARRDKSWFSIQQPEVHLHPKAQASLGDLFFRVTEKDNKGFLIETHSDFIVDRFRLNCRQHSDHKIDAQILFFERTPIGNQISAIPILPNGEYPEDQPKAFREFFLQEQINLLGV